LSPWVELGRLVRRPQTTWPSDSSDALWSARLLRQCLDPTLPFDQLGRILTRNFEDVARRRQLIDSAERLASTAVGLARAAQANSTYPLSLDELPHGAPVDAASGEPARYRRHPDGSVEIAFPTAQALAATPSVGKPHRGDLRRARILAWALPKPESGAIGD
jgi:hypothetical protein